MRLLLHPAYFPNIGTFAMIARNKIIWEVCDNYQKQTYRNRCYLCTDQGRHMLTIPIKHIGGAQGRQKYKEVRLDNDYKWQRQHWRTLQTAYRTSPFFEYYEDELAPLYEQPTNFLLDFNLKTIETICNCLQIAMPTDRTSSFQLKTEGGFDARFLVHAKTKFDLQQEEYTQVFGNRHGFIKNLSILDLLFNEGTVTMEYLEKQDLNFPNA